MSPLRWSHERGWRATRTRELIHESLPRRDTLYERGARGIRFDWLGWESYRERFIRWRVELR